MCCLMSFSTTCANSLSRGFCGQRGHVAIVGGENPLEVGKLIEDAGAQRTEWNLDFAEQPGNETVDFASCQRTRLARRDPFGYWLGMRTKLHS